MDGKTRFYYDLSPQSCSCLMLINLLKADDVKLCDVQKIKDEHNKHPYNAPPTPPVPGLVIRDLVLVDSHTILMFLCEAYDGLRFFPEDSQTRSHIVNIMYFDATVLQSLYTSLINDINNKRFLKTDWMQRKEYVHKKYQEINAFLSSFDYMAGDVLTIADLTMLTTISIIDILFPINDYIEKWAKLWIWFNRMRNLPVYKLNEGVIEYHRRIMNDFTALKEMKLATTEKRLSWYDKTHPYNSENEQSLNSEKKVAYRSDAGTKSTLKKFTNIKHNLNEVSNDMRKFGGGFPEYDDKSSQATSYMIASELMRRQSISQESRRNSIHQNANNNIVENDTESAEQENNAPNNATVFNNNEQNNNEHIVNDNENHFNDNENFVHEMNSNIKVFDDESDTSKPEAPKNDDNESSNSPALRNDVFIYGFATTKKLPTDMITNDFEEFKSWINDEMQQLYDDNLVKMNVNRSRAIDESGLFVGKSASKREKNEIDKSNEIDKLDEFDEIEERNRSAAYGKKAQNYHEINDVPQKPKPDYNIAPFEDYENVHEVNNGTPNEYMKNYTPYAQNPDHSMAQYNDYENLHELNDGTAYEYMKKYMPQTQRPDQNIKPYNYYENEMPTMPKCCYCTQNFMPIMNNDQQIISRYENLETYSNKKPPTYYDYDEDRRIAKDPICKPCCCGQNNERMKYRDASEDDFEDTDPYAEYDNIPSTSTTVDKCAISEDIRRLCSDFLRNINAYRIEGFADECVAKLKPTYETDSQSSQSSLESYEEAHSKYKICKCNVKEREREKIVCCTNNVKECKTNSVRNLKTSNKYDTLDSAEQKRIKNGRSIKTEKLDTTKKLKSLSKKKSNEVVESKGSSNKYKSEGVKKTKSSLDCEEIKQMCAEILRHVKNQKKEDSKKENAFKIKPCKCISVNKHKTRRTNNKNLAEDSDSDDVRETDSQSSQNSVEVVNKPCKCCSKVKQNITDADNESRYRNTKSQRMLETTTNRKKIVPCLCKQQNPQSFLNYKERPYSKQLRQTSSWSSQDTLNKVESELRVQRSQSDDIINRNLRSKNMYQNNMNNQMIGGEYCSKCLCGYAPLERNYEHIMYEERQQNNNNYMQKMSPTYQANEFKRDLEVHCCRCSYNGMQNDYRYASDNKEQMNLNYMQSRGKMDTPICTSQSCRCTDFVDEKGQYMNDKLNVNKRMPDEHNYKTIADDSNNNRIPDDNGNATSSDKKETLHTDVEEYSNKKVLSANSSKSSVRSKLGTEEKKDTTDKPVQISYGWISWFSPGENDYSRWMLTEIKKKSLEYKEFPNGVLLSNTAMFNSSSDIHSMKDEKIKSQNSEIVIKENNLTMVGSDVSERSANKQLKNNEEIRSDGGVSEIIEHVLSMPKSNFRDSDTQTIYSQDSNNSKRSELEQKSSNIVNSQYNSNNSRRSELEQKSSNIVNSQYNSNNSRRSELEQKSSNIVNSQYNNSNMTNGGLEMKLNASDLHQHNNTKSHNMEFNPNTHYNNDNIIHNMVVDADTLYAHHHIGPHPNIINSNISNEMKPQLSSEHMHHSDHSKENEMKQNISNELEQKSNIVNSHNKDNTISSELEHNVDTKKSYQNENNKHENEYHPNIRISLADTINHKNHHTDIPRTRSNSYANENPALDKFRKSVSIALQTNEEWVLNEEKRFSFIPYTPYKRAASRDWNLRSPRGSRERGSSEYDRQKSMDISGQRKSQNETQKPIDEYEKQKRHEGGAQKTQNAIKRNVAISMDVPTKPLRTTLIDLKNMSSIQSSAKKLQENSYEQNNNRKVNSQIKHIVEATVSPSQNQLESKKIAEKAEEVTSNISRRLSYIQNAINIRVKTPITYSDLKINNKTLNHEENLKQSIERDLSTKPITQTYNIESTNPTIYRRNRNSRQYDTCTYPREHDNSIPFRSPVRTPIKADNLKSTNVYTRTSHIRSDNTKLPNISTIQENPVTHNNDSSNIQNINSKRENQVRNDCSKIPSIYFRRGYEVLSANKLNNQGSVGNLESNLCAMHKSLLHAVQRINNETITLQQTDAKNTNTGGIMTSNEASSSSTQNTQKPIEKSKGSQEKRLTKQIKQMFSKRKIQNSSVDSNCGKVSNKKPMQSQRENQEPKPSQSTTMSTIIKPILCRRKHLKSMENFKACQKRVTISDSNAKINLNKRKSTGSMDKLNNKGAFVSGSGTNTTTKKDINCSSSK